MIRPRTPLLALLLLALPATATPSQSDVRAYAARLKAGRALLNDGAWAEAAEEFRKAREILPADWRGHAFQSVAHIQEAVATKDRDRRMGLLRQAGRVAADLPKRAGTRMTDPMYLYLRGVIMSAKNRDEGAYRTLERVVRAPRAQIARYADLSLHENSRLAFAQASMRLAGRMMRNGEFEKTVPMLRRARAGLEGIEASRRILAQLERRLGVACEQITNYEPAIRHLRNCIELTDDPEVREELTASISLILFNLERTEEAKAVLASLGEDVDHPDVVAARCMMRYKAAMRAPDGPVMDEALSYIRKALDGFPERERYFLAKLLADLVLEKVRPSEVAEQRELLVEMVELLKREAQHRPECPGTYFRLRRLYQLLGDRKKELFYDRLYAKKKREFDQKQKYDHTGRPRCR